MAQKYLFYRNIVCQNVSCELGLKLNCAIFISRCDYKFAVPVNSQVIVKVLAMDVDCPYDFVEVYKCQSCFNPKKIPRVTKIVTFLVENIDTIIFLHV